MSNKENVDFLWAENNSTCKNCANNSKHSSSSPPPKKARRDRTASYSSVKSSIKSAITVPFCKKPRSESMGSICIKSHVLPARFTAQLPPGRRFMSKVAPVIENEEGAKKGSSCHEVNFRTSCAHLNNIQGQNTTVQSRPNGNSASEDMEIYPEVFDEVAPQKVNSILGNGSVTSSRISSNGGIATTVATGNGCLVTKLSNNSALTTVEERSEEDSHSQRASSRVDGQKQCSLPNLRSPCPPVKQKKRFSQGDSLKMSLGSTNLMEAKKSFIEKRVRSVSTVVRETNIAVEKRRKRLPTVENGVHKLEENQVNYYQVLEEIGRGSFGAVCKCKSHKDSKNYAMKIISKKRLMRKNRQLSRKPGSKNNPLEPLYREVAILKKVDHPNVVRLLEVIDDVEVDNIYMIFELMNNGVVIDVPTDDPIPENRARLLFRDLLLGMEYLHYSKIIHRDIKPSNLLLDENDHVKIADFGVSNMFEGDNDLLNKYAGSPAFQAPEVLDYDMQDKYSGKAADVWAMGVTLYCFLYGHCPFYSENLVELSEMIKDNLVTFPNTPRVNPQVFDLISRMLSKLSKERITVGEMKDHPWVTEGGRSCLPSTEEHCSVIEVTEEEVRNSIEVRNSKLSALVMAKAILKGKSFMKSRHHKGVVK